MTIQRMDHVGIVVDDLAAAKAFFVELGFELPGEGTVEGGWGDRIVGLEGVRSEFAMIETRDGHGRLELIKFHSPAAQGGDRHALAAPARRRSRPARDRRRARSRPSPTGRPRRDRRSLGSAAAALRRSWQSA